MLCCDHRNSNSCYFVFPGGVEAGGRAGRGSRSRDCGLGSHGCSALDLFPPRRAHTRLDAIDCCCVSVLTVLFSVTHTFLSARPSRGLHTTLYVYSVWLWELAPLLCAVPSRVAVRATSLRCGSLGLGAWGLVVSLSDDAMRHDTVSALAPSVCW